MNQHATDIARLPWLGEEASGTLRHSGRDAGMTGFWAKRKIATGFQATGKRPAKNCAPSRTKRTRKAHPNGLKPVQRTHRTLPAPVQQTLGSASRKKPPCPPPNASKRLHLHRTHFPGVALVVEHNVAPNPLHILGFRADAVMLGADSLAHWVQ